MELGSQIKKHRMNLHLSQEELAEKVYVSRQMISNWENDKSYPDVHSLILLSEVFKISLDILIKGDIEQMKEQIHSEDIRKFKKQSAIFAVLLISTILLFIPLYDFLGYAGVAVWLALFSATMYFAVCIEKQKKKFDIQTYKEIVAFYEGKRLDEIAKEREIGKRPYQKIVFALASCVTAAVILFLLTFVFQ